MRLEVTYVISKFQDVSSRGHKLHKLKNQSCELQNLLSLYKQKYIHLEFHSGSSNVLTQITCHSNKGVKL